MGIDRRLVERVAGRGETTAHLLMRDLVFQASPTGVCKKERQRTLARKLGMEAKDLMAVFLGNCLHGGY